jgi:hypothetical protein
MGDHPVLALGVEIPVMISVKGGQVLTLTLIQVNK